MNKPPGKLENNSSDEDFTTSMARLAELAAQNITEDEKKREKDRIVTDEEFREFMTPKKRAPEKLGWSARLYRNGIKLRINPYVASGFLIIVISAGFICAPRISKYFEERAAELERKRAAASQVVSQTDASLKSYTVFDAARDVSNNEDPLKTLTISELAQKVAEANEKFGSKLEVTWNFGNFDLGPESKSDSEDASILTEDTSTSTEQNAIGSIAPDDYFVPENWATADLSTDAVFDFAFETICSDSNSLFQEGGEEVVLGDVLRQIGAIGGKKVTPESCS